MGVAQNAVLDGSDVKQGFIKRAVFGTGYKAAGSITEDDAELLFLAVRSFDFLLPRHSEMPLSELAELIEKVCVNERAVQIVAALRRNSI